MGQSNPTPPPDLETDPIGYMSPRSGTKIQIWQKFRYDM